MSEKLTVEEQRERLAAAFDREIDPLAKYAETFRGSGVDPFDTFLGDVVEGMDLAESTRQDYRRAVDQWREHMADVGRHPACPNEDHVKAFARFYLTKGNRGDTVKKKLDRLNKAYEYWQNDPAFPHPVDYNPFRSAMPKLSLSKPDEKEPPRIPIDDLADRIQGIAHIRDRAIVVAQCKLGLRAGAVCNLELRDVHLTNRQVARFYPGLGTHPALEGRRNAVYIATADERDGNKSERPRVLPLDEEMRRVLLRWLLVRPDTGDPWIFLSKENHEQLGNEGINHIWRAHFHPDYAESGQHRGVTSHFGRHRFTTYWRTEQDLNRDLVKYMRGDKTGGTPLDSRGAIDEYIHAYYEDVEDRYRERIFRLGL